MPPIKFRERLTKFMISISLSEKFCYKTALLKPLKIIFENSVSECKISGIWKLGSVTAILKPRSKLKPEKDWPII